MEEEASYGYEIHILRYSMLHKEPLDGWKPGVCVCVCVRACVHTHTFDDEKSARAHAHTHIFIYTHILNLIVFVHICMYTHM